ncbi:MAG: PAS domain S-box protein [Flavobacterium sp.]|nr:MAG: PAS domain S-box protein [Flavobacterium sp.]
MEANFNREILDALAAHIAVVDPTGKIIAANEAWRQYAKERAAVNGIDISEGSNYFEASLRAINEGVAYVSGIYKCIKAILDREVSTFEIEYCITSVNPVRWFILSGSMLPTGQVVLSRTEITDRKKTEQQLIYANRLYSFLSHINKTITHFSDVKSLFNDSCQISIETGGFDFAWIGISDGGKNLTMTACSGAAEDTVDFLNSYTYDVGGSIAKVLQGSEYEIVADIPELPDQKFNEFVKSRGLKSAICLPIRQGGSVIGTFNLYSTEKHFFIPSEINLLTEIARDISFALDVADMEEKRAEGVRNLQYKNIKLSEAQSLARLGNFEFDVTSHSAVWSQELLDIYGLPKDEPQQSLEMWLSHVHPEDREEVRKKTQEALTADYELSYSYRIIRSDGEVRTINSKVRTVLDAQGIPSMLIGIGQDVTEINDAIEALYASEDAFLKSESRYHQIIELVQEGIWIMNRKGETVYTSSKVSEILKYDPSELQGKDIYQFIDRTNKKDAVRSIQHLMKGKKEAFEIALRSKWDEPVWVSISSSIMKDEYGENQGLIMVITDVTKQRKSDEENRFKAILLKTIAQAVIATDEEGRITYWNKAAEEMFGWRPKDAKGNKCIDLLVPEEYRPAMVELFQELKSGKSHTGEILVHRRNGEVFPVFATDSPIFDSKRTFKGMICVASDITDKKKLVNQLKKVKGISQFGTWEANLAQNTLRWSSIVKQIHEVPPDFVPDMHRAISFYKPGPSRKAITNAMKEAIEIGKSWNLELEIITGNGNSRWVRTIGEAEFLNGHCIKLFGSIQNIHAQKSIEIELAELLFEKNLILQSLGDAFIVLNKNWEVLYFSDVAEIFLRKKSENVIGRNIWDIFPDAKGTKFEDEYQKAMYQHVPVQFEAYYEGLAANFSVNALPNSDGLTIFFKKL